MQTNSGAEQLCLFGQDTLSGKMSQEHSAVDRQVQPARTSVSSSKKSAALSTAPYLYLDLRAGHGNLLGPYWEKDSHLLGEYLILNTGPAPRNGGNVSTLSQILEASPHRKYYLSKTACLGILRRAKERDKKLPPMLEWALRIQAGQEK